MPIRYTRKTTPRNEHATRTLAQVSVITGLSVAYVHAVEVRALRKIRIAFEAECVSRRLSVRGLLYGGDL